MNNPDYQGDIAPLLYNGGKEEYVWNKGDPLGFLLVLPCSMIKVNGKLQQPNVGRPNDAPDPAEMEVWLTQPGKESWQAEMLAENKGNTEWVVEESNYTHQL